MEIIKWTGIEDTPVEDAVSKFFNASCVPGAEQGSTLCKLCKGDCSGSQNEPYYGYDGAFQCLAENAGEVAFVKHLTVPESEKDNYELLCKNGERAAISKYERCHLAKVPAHAVVTRKDSRLAELIYTSLTSVQNFDLFSSEAYAPTKNLMFKDSTKSLVRVPPNTDSFLYLGAEYASVVYSLKKEDSPVTSSAIRWCAVGHQETAKCDTWSINSIGEDGTMIECQSGHTMEECLEKIMSNDADAMAVDGGQVYTAGKCGLVPALVEQYDAGSCANPSASTSSYYAVAVVKRSSGLTWDTLRGKRSCHTGIGRTAGWNAPMGQVYKTLKHCNFNEYFVSGCAPGANLSSSFCANCAGSGTGVGDEFKCKANSGERYFGYAGAFRCLVEDAGDVAFIKHTTFQENTGVDGPDWAKNVNSDDYGLVCPKKGVVPISDYESCNLARAPAHAVVTRPGTRNKVVRILLDQQAKFGVGSTAAFKMFSSVSGSNLLFKDSTKCLQEVKAGTTYQEFLGDGYLAAMNTLRQCSGTASDLEKSCSFHSCQQNN
ncbi:hypothetical protein LDENG_00088240 [Lucifuga dentata]|nr:hypothetical protein LDENG_00088240 [Lucifuga dentata]